MSDRSSLRTPWPTDHPDYPRRLFQRREWKSLDGPWRFWIDRAGAVRTPSDGVAWDQTIQVPFAVESAASGIGDTSYHADVWYERDFDVPWSGPERTVLHFGAVDTDATVWVNGALAGRHRGGSTPFAFDVTELLRPGGPQTVTVWAHDDPHDLAVPRGKQDWHEEPHGIWYPRTTGIWQSVWLEPVPPAHIAGLRLSPDLDRWQLHCEAVIEGAESPLELRVVMRTGDRVLAEDRYDVANGEVRRSVGLPDPGIDDARRELLWTPDRPTLIEVDAQLVSSSGDVLDEIRSYTALRSVSVDRGRFQLNSRPYPLRLVLDQGYWPDTLMTPPSEEAIIRDIELVKAAGFNGVRKHQKIEDPRFLYWADRMGLLVWEELPSTYRFSRQSVQRATQEWMEVLERDLGHPCIVAWVPFNESWGVPDLPTNPAHRNAVDALYRLTKALDPSRPVIGNDGWEAGATDIVGIHDYDDDPERLRERYASITDALERSRPGGRVLTLAEHPYRGQPIILSEFGGIAHADTRGGDTDHGKWGYSTVTSSDELERNYGALLDAVSRVEAFAGFCYTQFTDTFQEANGLFYADRTPKFPLEAMRRLTRQGRGRPHEVQL